MLCVVAPKSIRGSRETARSKARTHRPSSVLRGSQVYTTRAARVCLHLPRDVRQIGEREKKNLIVIKTPGSSSKVPWPLS